MSDNSYRSNEDLNLRYMQIKLSIQSGSNLPGSNWLSSFTNVEFITMLEKSHEGLIGYFKLKFDDVNVLEHDHREMKILDIKSKTNKSALVKVLLTGPVPSLFLNDMDAWWVNPSHLDGNGMTLTIRGTKDALRIIRKELSKLVGGEISIKIGSETLNSPEFIDMLNEKQRLVMDNAIKMGYYARPRGCTQRDIALKMNIKQATVSQHLQIAESKIINFANK
ncbi:MAG: helix-turn-helix domain-containing protein [Candidatus Thalassarchaeaceae archaeon]|nr:helix-turn-helix domain-containing protein [Candidatus Thalassarchaeaceae archaeon]